MTTVATEVKEASILQKKLDKRLADVQGRNAKVIDFIEKEGNMLRDFIAPIGNSDKGVGDSRLMKFDSNGSVQMVLKNEKHPLHRHAVRQTAEKLGIPTKYARELAYGQEQWQRDLVAHIMNEHSINTDRNSVLVRMVGDEVRGVLSDKYRRLDTPMIYEAFFKEAAATGAQVIDANADDTRSWVEVLQPNIFPVETEHNGTTVMAFGARISNSDFGDGSLMLSAYNMQVICLNGMVGTNTIKQIHLGRQIPNDIVLSRETYLLDSQAQASLVKDATKQLISRESIMEQGRLVQKAGSILIEDIMTELPRLRDLGMLKGETEVVAQKITDNNPDEGIQGRNTVWKLSQAINATANTLEDARRKRDLEEIAGAFLLKKTA